MNKIVAVVVLNLVSVSAFASQSIKLDSSIKDKLCGRSAGMEIAKVLARQGQPANSPIMVSEISISRLYQVKTTNVEDGDVVFEVQTYDMREEDGTCSSTNFRELPNDSWEKAL